MPNTYLEPILAHVEFKLTSAPDLKQGAMHFKFEDCVAHLKDGETEIGYVAGNLGGGISIRLPDGREYTADPRALWNAVCAQTGQAEYMLLRPSDG